MPFAHWTLTRALLVLGAVFLTACEAENGSTTREAATAAETGQQVYQRFCFSCHASGAAGAPRVGDAAEWAARSQQGMDVMLDHTIEGMSGMPPRGMCSRCEDDELRDAIIYMLERSNGSG